MRLRRMPPRPRHLHSQPRYFRPWLEFLEDRTAPATYVALGDLGFVGDFSIAGTTYSARDEVSPSIQMGYKAPDNTINTFVPVYLIQGDVSFDTAATTLTFIVGQFGQTDFYSTFQVGTPPQYQLLYSTVTPTTFNVDDVANDGMALQTPYTLTMGQYLSFTINQLGLATLPGPNATTLSGPRLEGSLNLGATGSTQLQIAVNGTNFLTYTQNGFACTGVAVQGTAVFTIAGVKFQGTLGVGVGGLDGSGVSTTVSIWGNASVSFTSSAAAQNNPPPAGTQSNSQPTAFQVLFGDSNSPGITIDLGTSPSVTEISGGVSGSFSLEGLQASVPSANALTFTYVAATNSNPEEYEVAGIIQLSLTSALTFAVGMPEPLIISNGSWQFNSLAFSVSKIDLGGGWRLEELGFEFQIVTNPNTGATGYEWGGECKVVSPLKTSLGGELAFTLYDGGGVVLDTIGVQYVAGTDGGVLRLPGTGFYVQELAGELNNLNQLDNLQIAGDVAIGWGDNVTIGSGVYSMMCLNVSMLITSSEFVLDGSAYFGAKFKTDANGKLIRDSNGQPEVDVLLGSGNVNLLYDWASEQGSVSANVSLMDGTFTGDINFSIDQQLQILVDAQIRFNVPNAVPLIGGDKLASASFAFDWNGPTSNGFVAGWIDFFGQQVGISYNIADFAGGSSGWHFFGSNTIATAMAEIANGAAQASEKYAYSQIFAVPAGATGALFSVQLPSIGGDQDLAIIPVNWAGEPINRNTAKSQTVSVVNGNTYGNYPQNNQNNWVAFLPDNDGNLSVQLVGDPNNPATNLPGAGNATVYYKVILNSSVQYSTLPQWTALYTYTPPSVTVITQPPPMLTDPSIDIDISATVDAAFAAQTTVSLYAQPLFNGVPVANQAILIKTIAYNPHGMKVTWESGRFFPGQYQLFARLNTNYTGAGTPSSNVFNPNTPVTSLATSATVVSPPLTGVVKNQNQTGISGQVVWLDSNGNGVFDAPTYDPQTGAQTGGDLTTNTNGFGQYAFYYANYTNDPFVTNTTYTVGLVTVPNGYTLAQGQLNPISFEYTGQPASVGFNLVQSPTIAGTLASSTATSTASTPIDQLPPLAGWTVFLDLNVNGLLDPGEPETLTDNNGNYQFLNLNAGGFYWVVVVKPSGYNTVSPSTETLAGPYQGISVPDTADPLVYGVNYIFARQDTVSGTVMYYPFVNGAFSSTPVALSGAQITGLFGSTTLNATTNSQGYYAFTNQPPVQNYTLSTPPTIEGYRLMSPGTFNLGFTMNSSSIANFSQPIAMLNSNGGDTRTASSFIMGDFDSNGALDFTWVSPGHQTLYTAYGQPNFNEYNYVSSSVSNTWKDINFNRIVLLNDYYGDGGQYAAIADDEGNIFIMQATPDGDFGGWTTILTLDNHANVQPIDFKAGDLDGDGRPDFALAVSSSSDSATINIYLASDIGTSKPKNNSKATLPDPSFSYDTEGTNVNQGQLAIAPIMYNTQNAVIFSQGGSTPIMAYYNTTSNNTYWRTTIPGTWGPGALGIGDINNDTYADAVWGWFGGGTQAAASLTYSLGALTYATPDYGPINLPTPAANLASMPNILVQDFNGDFLSDILYITSNYDPVSRSITGSNPPASGIGVLLNQLSAFAGPQPAANGYFGSTPTLISTIGTQPSAPQASQLLPYDVNGDGLMDLVMADWANGEFVVFLNTSTYTAGQIQGTTSPTADSPNNDFIYAQVPGQTASAAMALAAAAGPNRGYVMGRLFTDRNGNGVMDPAETGRAGVRVFIDKNKNGRRDRNEPTTTTNVIGLYGFAGLKDGKYRVVAEKEANRRNTGPSSGRSDIRITAGQGIENLNFGSVVARDLQVAAGAGQHDWSLSRNGDRLELIRDNGVLEFSVLLSEVNSVSIKGTDKSADRFFIDYQRGGAFTVPGGITLKGGRGRGDAIIFKGSTGAETLRVGRAGGQFGPNSLKWSGIEQYAGPGLGIGV